MHVADATRFRERRRDPMQQVRQPELLNQVRMGKR